LGKEGVEEGEKGRKQEAASCPSAPLRTPFSLPGRQQAHLLLLTNVCLSVTTCAICAYSSGMHLVELVEVLPL
jgi:hypothetical protein